jgi:hypothetical protein
MPFRPCKLPVAVPWVYRGCTVGGLCAESGLCPRLCASIVMATVTVPGPLFIVLIVRLLRSITHVLVIRFLSSIIVVFIILVMCSIIVLFSMLTGGGMIPTSGCAVGDPNRRDRFVVRDQEVASRPHGAGFELLLYTSLRPLLSMGWPWRKAD